jgi:hypothetical protein
VTQANAIQLKAELDAGEEILRTAASSPTGRVTSTSALAASLASSAS